MSILLIEEFVPVPRPEELADQVRGYPGLALLRSGFFESQLARYSFLAVKPFLTFRSNGAHCEVQSELGGHVQFGNPWHVLREWLGRYELLDEVDFPFPLGGCFGYWGYDLKNFTEPKLTRRARNYLELPDCHLGFYGSLVVIDHRLDKSWIVCTGLAADGSRSEKQARRDLSWWKRQLRSLSVRRPGELSVTGPEAWDCPHVFSNISGETFVQQVKKAQSYIRAGDIYQVNLSHRLSVRQRGSGWNLFQLLSSVSPAPFAAYIDCGDFQIASSSPEMFLRMTGRDIVTRPIKGTRPRSADSIRDSQLAYELQTSAKETAELVMITDLLRNDLGKVCEFGSVQTPELLRLERYPQVQHLVSTVKGSLRARTSHLDALAACFPGGS